jgi:hypothetical protein
MHGKVSMYMELFTERIQEATNDKTEPVYGLAMYMEHPLPTATAIIIR